ncbi:helix-turn-helix domain-containing protein [Pseudonocardia benzenivorans]
MPPRARVGLGPWSTSTTSASPRCCWSPAHPTACADSPTARSARSNATTPSGRPISWGRCAPGSTRAARQPRRPGRCTCTRTVGYRLRRAGELTGLDLQRADAVFELRVAMMVRAVQRAAGHP